MLKNMLNWGPLKTCLLKLKMICDIILHNWNTSPISGLVHYKDFFQVEEDDVRSRFSELDTYSVEEAVTFIIRQK